MRAERIPIWMLLFWLVATMGWWAFAFAPVSPSSPEWFTAARNACFGTLETGLPDTYGWMVLILGPGSLFLGLLVAWYDELKSGLRRAFQSVRGLAVISVFAVLAFAEARMVWNVIENGIAVSRMSFTSGETGDLPSDYPRTALVPREFSLVNQRGEQVTLASLRGKVVLLTFAFAHCQTVCPALVQQAIQAVGDKDGIVDERFHLLIVTLDPWRDTPKSLPQLASKWNLPKNASVLSGSPDEVEKTIRSFNVPFERNTKTGDISHPALTFVIDPEGKVAYTFNNAPPRWLRAASERLAAGKVAAN